LFVLLGLAGAVLAQSPSQSPEATQTPTTTPETTQTASPTPTTFATASPTPVATAEPVPSASPEPLATASSRTAAPSRAPTTAACLDFATKAEAQAFYEAHGGPAEDPYGLDPERDGVACEDLQSVVENVPDGNPDLPQPSSQPAGVPDIPRTAPRNTTKLVGELECGLTLEEGAVAGMGRFPVAGVAHYFDDWHKARYTPSFHLHKGLDIFAKLGTPIRSPAAAVVKRLSNNPSSGGIGVSIEEPGGYWYYFGHLQRRAEGIEIGQNVGIGTVLGYVGDSGNARGGTPHVHMEIHENGVPIPPKPIVDGWLDEALGDAPRCVTSGPNAAHAAATPSPSAIAEPAPVPPAQRQMLSLDPSAARADDGYGARPVLGLLLMLVSLIGGMLVGRSRRHDEYKLIGW
jgi:murein DD-endopeptidase MepM/ murein hydrolase activator NlpD